MPSVLCMTQQPAYITPPEAARRLTEAGVPVSAETLKRWVRQGKIRAYRAPSGHIRFRPEDVTPEALMTPVAQDEDA